VTSSASPRIQLVVHGHFYQPPREDPWTGEVPVQPTAAPFHDWNERITAECYGPNTTVGVAGANGDFVVNLFEHLSFNVGPTLLSWLEPHHTDVYERILAADRKAGRAIAQAYGHAILPLCNERDLRTQVRWGIVDFRHRFGRAPEGMWLPETAVSDDVLAVLAEEGIRFTILAPGQIAAIRPLGADDDAWVAHGIAPHEGLGPVDSAEVASEPVPLDITRALRWRHPSLEGLGVDLVVYDGALAHALAFARPTSEDIVDAALAHTAGDGGLVAAATDGETFGHHHKGAEHDVAHALTVGAPAHGVATPRLADLLDLEPPTHEAQVRVSAWSCAHGVGRWMTDCGCSTGGGDGWTQAWRDPLRRALDLLRDWGSEAFERRGATLLRDPWAARDAYLGLLLGAVSWDDFAAEYVTGDHHQAGLLLDAQRNALLMYTSCGWFFNDLAGIETVQVLRYAARTIDLYEELGDAPPVEGFLEVLAEAVSNDPAVGDGRKLWFDEVLPR
jgi:alpha-amylase/alpha-mannosidase (GH57 family)